MTALSILGSQTVARAQTVVVIVVVGILSVFAVTTLANIQIDLLAVSDYPSLADIVSSIALTFGKLGVRQAAFSRGHRRAAGLFG